MVMTLALSNCGPILRTPPGAWRFWKMEIGIPQAPGALTFRSRRFGAEPPQSLVNLHEVATREVVAACGLNTGLWQDLGAATAREAWRLALFGVVAPLGRMVSAELTEKLNDAVTLGWQELRASDLSGPGAEVSKVDG